VRNATTKAEITESLIEPSAKVVAGFGIETIVLKDGTSFAGIVVKESAKTLERGRAAGRQNSKSRRLDHRFADHARLGHVPDARHPDIHDIISSWSTISQTVTMQVTYNFLLKSDRHNQSRL
jgi:hypothetical protein